MIDSLHSIINQNNVNISKFIGIRFAFTYGFIAISIIIIYMSYCFFLSINEIMMSSYMYNWTFRILGCIIQLSITFIFILRIAIKFNLLYHYFLQEAYVQQKQNQQSTDAMSLVMLFDNVIPNNELFSNPLQTIVSYSECILMSNVIWIILFKSKHPIIRGLIAISQFALFIYIKYSLFMSQDMKRLLIVNRLFMNMDILSLIYNIKWLYAKYHTKDMNKITLNDYLIHLNSIILLLGWTLCLRSSFITERQLFKNTKIDKEITMIIWENMTYFIYGIKMIILGNAVILGKSLSELLLYPINKEFFCYSSDKYQAFIKVVDSEGYEIIN